ncbi:MAG TPA: BON domain-containing protein [Rhizomicrobium sp.]|jgi:osmotically-inducible protein OsmY|nr:BON domain-containing protein [Rhizomicrobium sp.]
MANWQRRDGNRRDRIERNYADVEFANATTVERNEYERDRADNRGRRRDYAATDINQEDYPSGRRSAMRDRSGYEQMYGKATRDYAGYGSDDVYAGEGAYIPRRTSERRGQRNASWGDPARLRDEGRFTDRSAYNPQSRGRDLGPGEFEQGAHDYWRAYGARGVQSRPEDFYRNRGELYGGRPEARGWRPDEETTEFGPHRGRGPKDYRRSDERIHEDVNDRLTDDHDLDASAITVQVKDGEVTLNGHVDSKFAKRRAEDIADMVPGASHVQNNLRVRRDEARSSWSGTSANEDLRAGVRTNAGKTSEYNAPSPGTASDEGITAQRTMSNGNNGTTFG